MTMRDGNYVEKTDPPAEKTFEIGLVMAGGYLSWRQRGRSSGLYLRSAGCLGGCQGSCQRHPRREHGATAQGEHQSGIC